MCVPASEYAVLRLCQAATERTTETRLLLGERASHHFVMPDNSVKERPAFAQLDNKVDSIPILVSLEELHSTTKQCGELSTLYVLQYKSQASG